MHPPPSGSRRRRRPWADLPPDLLRDVSGRLHDVADNVRFHAVCRPWRGTSPFPLFRVNTTPCDGLNLHSTVDSPQRPLLPSGHGRSYAIFARFTGKRNWVASSDGTAVWLFTARPRPRLLNLVTRDVTSLPPLPGDEIMRSMKYSRGTVYGDGTVFLYSFMTCSRGRLLHIHRRHSLSDCPGDTVWTIVKKSLYMMEPSCIGAMYHGGKVILFMDVRSYFWWIMTPNHKGDMKYESHAQGGRLEAWMSEYVEISYFRYSYFLRSHGELLWVTIFVNNHCRDPTKALSVDVHMLEGSSKGGTMRWVTRNGRSLSDRVFFLGSPASFTVDVSHRDANGGCVYFVYDRCVFVYSLVDREAKVVERLRPGWGSDKAHVWLRH